MKQIKYLKSLLQHRASVRVYKMIVRADGKLQIVCFILFLTQPWKRLTTHQPGMEVTRINVIMHFLITDQYTDINYMTIQLDEPWSSLAGPFLCLFQDLLL